MLILRLSKRVDQALISIFTILKFSALYSPAVPQNSSIYHYKKLLNFFISKLSILKSGFDHNLELHSTHISRIKSQTNIKSDKSKDIFSIGGK